MESSLEERQGTLWREGSLFLSLGGWAVLLSAITTFLFAIFPLKLGAPQWQLNSIYALYIASASILTGSLLVCTARMFNPTDSQLKKNVALIQTLAGILSIILLATIPLSLYAGYRTIKSNEAQSKVALKEWKKQLEIAQSFASEAEMRSWAASQPEPIILAPVFPAPFPVIKQRLIDNFTGRVNSVQNQIEENFRSQWLSFLVDLARNSIQALLLAIAFSALSTGGIIRNILLSIFRYRIGLGTGERNRGAI
jgi:hypothetical protein